MKDILKILKEADRETIVLPKAGKRKEITLNDLERDKATMHRGVINIPLKDSVAIFSISAEDLKRFL